MKKIYLLTDYKGYYGSKYTAKPYRSGMDKKLLEKYFTDCGFQVKYIAFSDIDFRKIDFKDQYVLYTSSEDIGYHYKDYIEDMVLGLSLQGARIIPEYKYLRANNNKVFMEILRDLLDGKDGRYIKTHHFGTIEELKEKIDKFQYPVVIKSATGAMSRGVFLADNGNQLIKIAEKISRTKYLFKELWDLGRSIKHKGYKKESKYRKKFIVQNFIPGLNNDWKILIYGDKYYILYRGVRKNDFRASGSGKFYFYTDLPNGILDYAENIFRKFNVPNLSIDVGYNSGKFYLIEFQMIYFGTTTIEKAPFYYTKEDSKWIRHNNKSELEKAYVDSIVKYIEKNNA